MKKSIIIFSGIILIIISILFDKEIVSSVLFYRTSILTTLMHGISFFGSAIVVLVMTTLLFLYDKNKRKYIPLLWLTLIVSFGTALILKYLIARPRPILSPLELEDSYSFPSGHAVAIFAPLLLIDKLFPKIKWLWLALGTLVLISRIYLGVHYMSDVIGGALIGYIIGIITLEVTNANI